MSIKIYVLLGLLCGPCVSRNREIKRNGVIQPSKNLKLNQRSQTCNNCYKGKNHFTHTISFILFDKDLMLIFLTPPPSFEPTKKVRLGKFSDCLRSLS